MVDLMKAKNKSVIREWTAMGWTIIKKLERSEILI